MYRYLFRNKRNIFLYMLLAPVSALCSLAMSAAMAAAMDYANGGELSEAWKYVVTFGGYILLDLLVDQVFRSVSYRLAKDTVVQLRGDVYRKISRMNVLDFSRHSTADYIANLTADVNTLRTSYFQVILDLYMDVFRFSLASIALFWVSPILGGFVLVTSILQTVIPILFDGKLKAAGARSSDAQEKHMAALKEGLAAFTTAKTFHIEGRLESRYGDAVEAAEEENRRLKMLKTWVSNLSFVLSRVTHLGVLLLGAVLAIRGMLSPAAIMGASELIIYISNPVYFLNRNLADLRSAQVPSRKLKDLLEAREDMGGSATLTESTGSIAVRDLSFSYGERPVLSDLSYEFQAGKKYLILGASGSGKSTFLSLLAGLRKDYAGRILLDGMELREITRESLTQNLCAITQEPYLFDDTLYNNICLFADVEEAVVADALCRVGLERFVEKLHSPLGENAASMSGGEKQRVAIARALVRRTSVLLLDESTSHLDPKTAAEIEHLVLGLEGVTVLLVSHNATKTAREQADVILEVRDRNFVKAEKELSF